MQLLQLMKLLLWYNYSMQSALGSLSGTFFNTLAGISADFLILAIIFLAIFFYGFFRGKEKIVSLILSFYISAFLYIYSGFLNSIILFKQNQSQMVLSKIVIFLIVAAILHFLLNRFVRGLYSGSRFRNILENILLSLSATCLLISFSYHIIPIQKFYNFSTAVDQIFASSFSFTIWLFVPIVYLFFLSRE